MLPPLTSPFLANRHGGVLGRDGLLGVGVVDVLAVLSQPQPIGTLTAAARAANLAGGDDEVGAGLLDRHDALVVLDFLGGVDRVEG